MVLIITSPHSLQRVLNYNESKCQKGQAQCLHAENYILAAEAMNFHEKMQRMQDLIDRNERTKKTNTLHISINFHPSEKYSKEQLIAIANAYMEKIGFGHQPYMVYEHYDAGHPHLHIVTTTIQTDGKRINTYNIGRIQSEKARKEIELEFGLRKAQDPRAKVHEVKIGDAQCVQYGKSETRRSIANVLDKVLTQFNYTSLSELNAVLKQYNVMADRGSEQSRRYRHEGLVYHMLDEKGKKVGAPVKASLFHQKPTLKYLQQRFEENKIKRGAYKQKLKTTIDWVLARKPDSLEALRRALQKEKITTVLSENKEGAIYGITFLDFGNKSVFKGSELGKSYSFSSLQRVIAHFETAERLSNQSGHTDKCVVPRQETAPATEKLPGIAPAKIDLLKDLMETEKNLHGTLRELLKKKRKKRNQNL